MLTVLEVCLCKPAMNNLKILVGEKLEYDKSMGEPQKGGTKFLNFSGKKQKGGLQFLT